jgi:hypothetical protein
MDPICGDDDVGLGGRAVGEQDPGYAAVLLKTAAAVSGATVPGGKASASILTRSGRGIPKVAFQPEVSVT